MKSYLIENVQATNGSNEWISALDGFDSVFIYNRVEIYNGMTAESLITFEQMTEFFTEYNWRLTSCHTNQ